jgi:hypothetical protein
MGGQPIAKSLPARLNIKIKKSWKFLFRIKIVRVILMHLERQFYNISSEYNNPRNINLAQVYTSIIPKAITFLDHANMLKHEYLCLGTQSAYKHRFFLSPIHLPTLYEDLNG